MTPTTPDSSILTAYVVLLDAGPLGMLTQRPGYSQDVFDCQAWFEMCESAKVPIYLPEIADYEVRRELLRARKTASVARLDAMRDRTRYLPITTAAMRLAATLWATARQQGRPTAPDDSLDADMILSAQALDLGMSGLVIATSNPRHLSRFDPARPWREISI